METTFDFAALLDAYKASSNFKALSERSKKEYKKPLERLMELGNGLCEANAMPMPVAVAHARSRRHVDYWFDKIVSSDTTDYEKGRLVLFCRMVYRTMGLGYLVEGLKLPTTMRHQRGEAHPITPAQVKAILAVEDPALKTYAVFVAFCFYTAMRPSEVFNLKWEDVGEEFIVVIGSKKRQAGVPTRMIPILPEIRACLDYCKTLGSKWVFVSTMRKALNKDVVCQKVRQIFEVCGVHKDTVLYDTRRGVATEMARQGYSLLHIRDLLGHKNVRTTEEYIRMGMKEKAANYKGVVG